MGDMADYYDSRYDGYDGCDYHEDYYNDSKYENLMISYSLSVLKAKAIYNINSKEKVGSEITCPVCKVKFKKRVTNRNSVTYLSVVVNVEILITTLKIQKGLVEFMQIEIVIIKYYY